MEKTESLSLFATGPDGDGDPPDEVYAAQVQNLFLSIVPVVAALGCTSFVSALAATRTGNWFLGAAAALQIAAGAYRVAVHVRFRAHPPRVEDSRAVYAAWERRFAVGVVATAAVLGATCLGVFVLTDDPISQLLVDATSVGYTAGAVGRNFPRRKLAQLQVALPMGSVLTGAALHGGFPYYTLAVFTLLYCLAAAKIASDLCRGGQRLLMLVLDNARLAEKLSNQNRRLDAALTNMSHGLCMIDGETRLILANRRMSELFGLPATALAPGALLADLLAAAAPGRCADPDAVSRLIDDLKRPDDALRDTRLRLDDGSVISWSKNPATEAGAVVIFEDVTERERAQTRAEYLSTHDSLTGLPNRFMFDELLNNAVKLARLYEKPFALMFIDLDRFKFVNDTLGHAAGDALLLEMATRLKANLRVSNVVARLGGDEFVVIFHDFVGYAQAEAIAFAIAEALAEPCSLDGHEYVISASIGLALYPDDASEAQSLLKCADAAMYQVKREGKNGVRHFTGAIAAPSVQRLDMESALRHGLERDEFVLHYQPQRPIASQAVSGVEALLRWRHPSLGLLSPDKFIDLAEETGLILPIGRWVIEMACRQTEGWRRIGLPDFRVAVNLSPRQFADNRLIQVIKNALGACGMPARLLEIEITESMAMRDSARSEAVIRQIRALGVRVSIDDFGAGHSSMARLKHLSIDGIKIDRGFVRGLAVDVRDRAIVEAICTLGHALQLKVVGEGVETAEQKALLAQLHCDEIQGFLFARPMPAEQIPDFVRKCALARLGEIVESSQRNKLGLVEELGARIA
jgi:diguanylate cyclase (GGDEF)-like protein